jgi:pimeloyl-ACP methyl ester carboxylesterase
MTTLARHHDLVTSHGTVAVEEVGKRGLPVLMIHGNSSCRGVFRHQLLGPLAERHRLIALDLPGHGQSEDAPDPMRSYTRSGFADVAAQVLEQLGVTEAVVLGWSLGGHIAIDMIPRFAGLRGLVITGTPPVSRTNMAQGFLASPHGGIGGRQDLSESDIDIFVETIFGASLEPFLRDAVKRADGRFRKRVFEASRAGDGVDQRLTVETTRLPIAVINGSEDRMVNLDYIDTVAFGNLWDGRCHRLERAGHASFWETSERFALLLDRFLRDVETGAAIRGA